MRKLSKKNMGNIFSVLFLIVNIIVVIYLGSKEFLTDDKHVAFSEMLGLWQNNAIFFIAALLCIALAIIAEGLKFFVLIKKTTGQKRLKLSLKTALMGKYYDNVTPFGSGGQPFQVYLLNQANISGGIATSLPILCFFYMQLAFIFLCAGVFIFNHYIVSGEIRILAYIGAFFCIVIPLCLVLSVLCPRIWSVLADFVIKLLSKLNIVKDAEAAKQKISRIIDEYVSSIKTISKQPMTVIMVFVLSLIYQIALCSIPYFVIRAGGYDAVWFDSLAMCVYLYAAVAFIPTPGNSGAAEISFALIFTQIMQGGVIFWSMLYWRFCCYYVILLSGLFTILYDIIRAHLKRKRILKEHRNIL